MTLSFLGLSFSTLVLSDISESIFEIIAVAVFYAISWALERRKKKEQPQPTPEEVLEEAGIIFDTPVEIELPESVQPAPAPAPVAKSAPESKPVPVKKTKDSVEWKAVKTGFRSLNARTMSIAQDFGRLPSMRTIIRDFERSIRVESRKRLDQFEEARQHWGDARVQQDAETILRSLHEGCDFIEMLGKKRSAGDVEWRRWDQLATSLYSPLQQILQQRGQEGGYKHLLVVSGAAPLTTLSELLPNWGFIQGTAPNPMYVMNLLQGIARDLVGSNRTLMLDLYQELEGDPTQRTFDPDGSIRLSGTHNLIAAWMPTLINDTVCAMLAGPGYLRALDKQVTRATSAWMESDIPKRGRSVEAPGIIRRRWTSLVLEKLSLENSETDESYFDNGVEFSGLEGELPVEVLETALREALDTVMETPLDVLGGSALGKVTNFAITAAEGNRATKWLEGKPPAHLERHNWRTWAAGALQLNVPDEAVNWWRAILPKGAKTGANPRSAEEESGAKISWQQGFIDRAIFTGPRGVSRHRRRLSL